MLQKTYGLKKNGKTIERLIITVNDKYIFLNSGYTNMCIVIK